MSMSTFKEKLEIIQKVSIDNYSIKGGSESESAEKKTEIVWVNNIKADGGAYKGCPKNDYCQHLVDTGERPQNFIRDYEEEKRFLDYPKLNELIKRKNEVLQRRATPPMYLKCDLKNIDFTNFGKFDVILIDPPLAEYSRRAQNSELGLTPELTPWPNDDLLNLRIDLLADNCCFLFIWVGSEEGLDFGRILLKKWNFRRCEDIVWIKTNKGHAVKKRIFNENTLLQHTKEHCLVGIKGAVKRGADSHFIHANIDTDIIVSEEPPLASTEKPQELYRIIERFCLGRKRIELFGEDHNIRPGWLTLDKYNNWFKGDLSYPELQGYEGGRFIGSTPEIENLRPRSPIRNQNATFLFGGNNNSQNTQISYTPFYQNINNIGFNINSMNGIDGIQNFNHFDPSMSMVNNLAPNIINQANYFNSSIMHQNNSSFPINSSVFNHSNYNMMNNNHQNNNFMNNNFNQMNSKLNGQTIGNNAEKEKNTVDNLTNLIQNS